MSIMHAQSVVATSKPKLDISGMDTGINHLVTDPADATVTVVFETDGSITLTNGTDSKYIAPAFAGIGSSYEVKVTETSGTVSSGTVGSYLAITSNRTWTLTRTIIGVSTCTLTFDIREIAVPLNASQKTGVVLTADVDSGL